MTAEKNHEVADAAATATPMRAATATPTAADVEVARGLCDFVAESPSAFHAVAACERRLAEAGFVPLREGDAWDVEPGGSYYVTRNNSSIVAFRVGANVLGGATAADPATGADPAAGYHFQLLAAHSDSPTFKVKTSPELSGPEGYLRLDVEAYGGMIDHTWFDRPLSVAGRALVRDGARVESRLVAPDRDIAVIPSLAIHLDHSVNESFSPNRQVDLCPVMSAGALSAGAFDRMVAREAGCEPDALLARDLFLVNRQRPVVWGEASEFVSAPRLDDLMCAYVALRALVASDNDRSVSVVAIFDNEEVGSNTKQGAMSTLLRDTLSRVSCCLGLTDEQHLRALSRSMLVSCDNAHAVHPNHAEKHDEANRCRLNGGIAIKEAANQHYCTDAFSRAVFAAILDDAGVPHQAFANRSDMAGGSTLGNLSNMQVSMHAVDVGLPQLAMHSCFETAGVADVVLGEAALRAFLSTNVVIDGADGATLG